MPFLSIIVISICILVIAVAGAFKVRDKFTWVLGCFVLFLLFCASTGAYYHFDQMQIGGFEPRWEDTFTRAFDSPISEISELKGGGAAWLDTDLWIRFKCKSVLVLKSKKSYLPINLKDPVEKFSNMAPQDAQFLANVDKCLEWKHVLSDQSPPFYHWLLCDTKDGVYWYRECSATVR